MNTDLLFGCRLAEKIIKAQNQMADITYAAISNNTRISITVQKFHKNLQNLATYISQFSHAMASHAYSNKDLRASTASLKVSR